MALYASETLALNMNRQCYELKIEMRKIIQKLSDTKKTDEGNKLTNTNKTTQKHSNIEKDLIKGRVKYEGYIGELPVTRLTKQLYDMMSTLKKLTNWMFLKVVFSLKNLKSTQFYSFQSGTGFLLFSCTQVFPHAENGIQYIELCFCLGMQITLYSYYYIATFHSFRLTENYYYYICL